MHEAEWQMGKKRIDTRLDQLTPLLPPPRCFGATVLARAFAGKPASPTCRQADKTLMTRWSLNF